MVEEKANTAWLDELFPDAKQQVAVRNTKAYEFSQLYLIFDNNPIGRQLLAHWVTEMEARDVPPAASHAEYAYWEGRRAFIRGIQRQVALAKNPPPGTLPNAVQK